MLLNKDTKSYQEKLAKFTRDGNLVDIEGVRKDRLHHYRRLTFNIQLQTMEQAFPITYSFFEFDNWKSMVHDFFNQHDPQTPQIWKLPFEFYRFVKENNYALRFDMPFLNDLLLFEWVEIELHTMKDQPMPNFSERGDLEKDVLIVNPEFKLNKLEYPVHKIKPNEITEDLKGNYFLLSYREKETGAVHFIDLSILHTFAFEKIVAEKKSISKIINEAIEMFGNENAEFIKESIPEFGEVILKKKIALGYQK